MTQETKHVQEELVGALDALGLTMPLPNGPAVAYREAIEKARLALAKARGEA